LSTGISASPAGLAAKDDYFTKQSKPRKGFFNFFLTLQIIEKTNKINCFMYPRNFGKQMSNKFFRITRSGSRGSNLRG
jgi:hypothetical protein